MSLLLLNFKKYKQSEKIMVRLKEIHKLDFDSIPVDPFWNIGSERELKMHRIHSYPAKFPAFITTKALEYAEMNSVKVKIIGDIFCGCGTTAYESKRNNIDFWGCDINPVATMIAKTKSQKYQGWRLNKYLKDILETYESTIIINEYGNAKERLKYWFKEHEYNCLFHLKKTIELKTSNHSNYRRFFICAFSNILKPTSVWLTKSIKPQVDPNKKPADVIKAFKKQCFYMINANEQSNFINNSKTNIETCSFLSENIKMQNVDLIITSPPYVTSYEYADLHQLSSLWLNYAEDYRDLRNGSIGSLYHDYNFNREWKRLNITGNKIVASLLDQGNSKVRSVAKYFLDMQEVTRLTFKILNDNGIAVFVIGNTEFKGVLIDNAKHLAESLQNSGFSRIFVTKRKVSKKILTPYRDERGKFSIDASGRKVYSEEYIIIGEK